MRLIDSQKLKNNVIDIPSADEPSNYANCDVHIAYLNGKAQRQNEILELIDKQKEVKNTSEDTAATTKKKRKLKAKTYKEFCDSFDDSCRNCPFCDEACGLKGDMPCKPNGKYIFVEIKE